LVSVLVGCGSPPATPTPLPLTPLPPPTATTAPTATMAHTPTAVLASPTAIIPPTATALAATSTPRPGAQDLAATPDGRTIFPVSRGKLLGSGFPVPPGRLLALDANRLVAGEMPSCARGGGSPVKYSTDGGKSWQETARGLMLTPWLVRDGELYAL